MMTRYALLAAVVTAVALGTVLATRPGAASAKSELELARIAALSGKTVEAKARLSEIIASDAGPRTRPIANRARMELGYLEAKQGDFVRAREVFAAVPKPLPSERPSPEFGTAYDQATYQAIVCLVAEGKQEEARKQFRNFLKERPQSPLIVAVFRRLTMLSGGEPSPEDIQLFEQAQKLQDQFVRREMALCGPKALAHFLELSLAGEQDFRAIAREVGTDDQGTTVNAMVKALIQRGCTAEARELNAPDFRKVSPPAIWFKGDHFVVIESFQAGRAKVYDPMDGKTTAVPLPDGLDGQFRAILILAGPPKRVGWASAPVFKTPHGDKP